MTDDRARNAHQVSVVIPVYQGARTLPGVVAELAEFVTGAVSPGGRRPTRRSTTASSEAANGPPRPSLAWMFVSVT